MLERALGARLVYERTSVARAINYEYLNRQLVWSELSEVLLFLLPLVNAAAVKRALRSVLPRLPTLTGAPGAAPTAKGAAEALADGSNTLPCGICGTAEILAPYEAQPCGHVFCYFCLRSHVMADEEYQCPSCLVRVVGMAPLRQAEPLDTRAEGTKSAKARLNFTNE